MTKKKGSWQIEREARAKAKKDFDARLDAIISDVTRLCDLIRVSQAFDVNQGVRYKRLEMAEAATYALRRIRTVG